VAETTIRVSVHTDGTQGGAQSLRASISLDGTRVAFTSFASNLVDSDTNAVRDVFMRNITSSTTTRVSIATGGTQANDFAETGVISGDGRYVVFHSQATNLVASDTNNRIDLFRHDTQTGTTVMVSLAGA